MLRKQIDRVAEDKQEGGSARGRGENPPQGKSETVDTLFSSLKPSKGLGPDSLLRSPTPWAQLRDNGPWVIEAGRF